MGTMLAYGGLSTAPNCSWTIVAEDWRAGAPATRQYFRLQLSNVAGLLPRDFPFTIPACEVAMHCAP